MDFESYNGIVLIEYQWRRDAGQALTFANEGNQAPAGHTGRFCDFKRRASSEKNDDIILVITWMGRTCLALADIILDRIRNVIAACATFFCGYLKNRLCLH